MPLAPFYKEKTERLNYLPKVRSLSHPCSFCPVRFCQGMECREVVTQVTEEAGKPTGEGGWGQKLREAAVIRRLYRWKEELGLAEGARSTAGWPAGAPAVQEAERRGNTTHPPPPVSCQLAKPILGQSVNRKHPCYTNRTRAGQESSGERIAQICTRKTVLKINQLNILVLLLCWTLLF